MRLKLFVGAKHTFLTPPHSTQSHCYLTRSSSIQTRRHVKFTVGCGSRELGWRRFSEKNILWRVTCGGSTPNTFGSGTIKEIKVARTVPKMRYVYENVPAWVAWQLAFLRSSLQGWTPPSPPLLHDLLTPLPAGITCVLATLKKPRNTSWKLITLWTNCDGFRCTCCRQNFLKRPYIVVVITEI